jgi:hypothetical protein
MLFYLSHISEIAANYKFECSHGCHIGSVVSMISVVKDLLLNINFINTAIPIHLRYVTGRSHAILAHV